MLIDHLMSLMHSSPSKMLLLSSSKMPEYFTIAYIWLLGISGEEDHRTRCRHSLRNESSQKGNVERYVPQVLDFSDLEIEWLFLTK